jgi:hypothetical protein
MSRAQQNRHLQWAPTGLQIRIICQRLLEHKSGKLTDTSDGFSLVHEL